MAAPPQSNQRGIETSPPPRSARLRAPPQSNQRGIETTYPLECYYFYGLRLNRTSVGLKLILVLAAGFFYFGLNRTSVGLKLRFL